MGILIFLTVGIASFILTLSIFKSESIKFNIIISAIIGIVMSAVGTYRGCADGWLSTSIGRQGACSHHGGVKTFLNIYGSTSLAISITIIVITFIVIYYKSNK